MKFSRLAAAAFPVATGGPSSDPEIRLVSHRSAEMAPGGLFVAVPGFKVDGHAFLARAAAAGAAALVVQRDRLDGVAGELRSLALPWAGVENARSALALISGRFHGDPSRDLRLVGITGTNGKTTLTYLVEKILVRAGFRAGVIGTINYRYNGRDTPAPMTTPEAPELQRILAEMAAGGVTHVVMEASSHALDLHRLDGCHFDVGVFTNLSQDHLDHHRDMAGYWESKRSLFTRHLGGGCKRAAAVVNRNDPKGRELADAISFTCITVGDGEENRVWARLSRDELDGMAGRIRTPAGPFDFRSALVGGYNLENILCAVGVGIALGVPLDAIREGIEGLRAVPGRLEPVENDLGRFVYVDYAHTPAALENVLQTLRRRAAARIITVFGCGGDRDRDKRPKMGRIAGELSDLTIVTSDNPRTEPPTAIIDDILPGVARPGTPGPAVRRRYTPEELPEAAAPGYAVEPDRRKAIDLGVRASRPGDILLIAGKGHETYQVVGDRTLPFDDRAVARKALDRYPNPTRP